jgi:hypothetical protein
LTVTIAPDDAEESDDRAQLGIRVVDDESS